MTWKRYAAGSYYMHSGFPTEWIVSRGCRGTWDVWECFTNKKDIPVALVSFRTKREAQRYAEKRADDWGRVSRAGP
jgi:hypothetical protein